jgi:hypothetical protein
MLTKPPATPLANIIAAKHELFVANRDGMPHRDPCRFYWKLVPRELETQVQAVQAFAKINGWKVSRGSFGLRALAGCKPSEPWSGQIHCRNLFDHCLYFRKHRRPAALVAQPYPGEGYSRLDEAGEIADWLGLKLSVPPAPKASIHYPGGTVLMVFTARDHEIRWLPEMVSGVGRAHRLCRVRIVGRAEAA